ncbi:uncharacterized protein LOC111635876 [Centruroides sculpturatus]|uniref:uncharacterized protein LOC111635876 n=1 Tax=Centruroides sculpturatus TaxID=218467 RepID=UPI000C6E06A7|nr:uncharacterized protein LOC111635876 [Centruroides sculpturatus]
MEVRQNELSVQPPGYDSAPDNLEYGLPVELHGYRQFPEVSGYGPIPELHTHGSELEVVGCGVFTEIPGHGPVPEIIESRTLTKFSAYELSSELSGERPAEVVPKPEARQEELEYLPESGMLKHEPSDKRILQTDVPLSSDTPASLSIPAVIDENCAEDFNEDTNILQRNKVEIDTKIIVESTTTHISADSDYRELNSVKDQDFVLPSEQITASVIEDYVDRPLKKAFIYLEKFSLVKEIIYEEDECDIENDLLENDANAVFSENAFSNNDANAIEEIDELNVDVNLSTSTPNTIDNRNEKYDCINDISETLPFQQISTSDKDDYELEKSFSVREFEEGKITNR